MAETTKRPNILFLMTDEHRFDIAGFMGNPIVRTPNLDRLAKDAVIFDNAYAHNPICIPGRQCMLAGEMSTTCGCKRWLDDLPPNYVTFPRVLSQYGYETVAAGKLHLVGQDQMQGFTTRIGAECHVSPKYIPDLKEMPKAGTDFKWTQDKEVARAGIGESYHQKEDRYALDGLLMYIDERFLSPMYDRAMPDSPIMLKLSLNQPHYPYFTDEKKFKYYLNRVEEYENQHNFEHDFLSLFPPKASSRDMKRAMAAYYGMIETADEYFGRVIEALENVGQNIDDWIIVYTTDHGEMLGEHNVMEKQKFYEGSVRIPLFIRYPKKFAPKRVKENVSNIDLFATLLDLCNTPCEKKTDSRSLTPLLSGEGEWFNEVISQFGGTNIMIKRDNLKYHFYTTSQTEFLFDLEKDPAENENYLEAPENAAFVDYCRKKKAELGF